MRSELFIVVFLSSFGIPSALKCWSCRSPRGMGHCDRNGRLQTCSVDQTSCYTVVYRTNIRGFRISRWNVRKGCKQEQSCRNDEKQNGKESGKSTQCNIDQPNSRCSCCCDTDNCNFGALRCTRNLLKRGCQDHPSLPHGRVKCSKQNAPGSVCSFECINDNYSVFPIGHDSNVCQEDGSWNTSMPCCARPCPPYGLADIVTLYHATSIHMYQHMVRVAFLSAELTVIADDAVRYAGLYYSGEPNVNSVVNFNEYETKEQMQALFMQRLVFNNTADGKVNTGAAMWYAYNHMFGPGTGSRDNYNVPKIVLIITDQNSHDDVVAPAIALREKGVLLYVLALHEEDEGFEHEPLNYDHFMDITGRREHLYMPGHEVESVGIEIINEFANHFCEDPCKHVMHEHDV